MHRRPTPTITALEPTLNLLSLRALISDALTATGRCPGPSTADIISVTMANPSTERGAWALNVVVDDGVGGTRNLTVTVSEDTSSLPDPCAVLANLLHMELDYETDGSRIHRRMVGLARQFTREMAANPAFDPAAFLAAVREGMTR